MVLKLTLDTNCIIDLDEGRENAQYTRCLVDWNTNGSIELRTATSSASEKQSSGQYLANLQTFFDRLDSLGLGNIRTVPPILYFDISFLDDGLLADQKMIAREKEIYEALFPNKIYDWQQTAETEGCDLNQRDCPSYRKWRNRLLDAQAYWAHENAGGDIFVTSDLNFSRGLNGANFENAWICNPLQAVRAVEEHLEEVS